MKPSHMNGAEHRLDPQVVEWIQADLDGELGAEESRQLQHALAASDEARAYQEQMRRVCDLLDEVPSLDPPLGLTRTILDHLPSHPLPEKPPSRLAEWLQSMLQPASYGLAVAAGMVLMVGLVQLVPQGDTDLSAFVGTMVGGQQELPRQSAAELQLDLDRINGRVALKELRGSLALEFNLQAGSPLSIEVSLDNEAMEFGGFTDSAVGDSDYEISGGNVRVKNEGPHHFVLFLKPSDGTEVKPQEISIRLSDATSEIYTGTLSFEG